MDLGMQIGKFIARMIDLFFGNALRFLFLLLLPKSERGRLSWNFVGTLAILLIYGLVVLFSASYSTGYAKTGNIYHYIRPQLLIAIAGFLLMLALSNINYRALEYAQWPLYLVTIGFLIWALFSEPQNGHYRWVFPLGSTSSFSIQPSEIAKFSSILSLATYTHQHYEKRGTLLHGMVLPVLPLSVYVVLLLLEPHRSAIILIAVILFTMMVCGGCGFLWPYAALPVGIVGAFYMLTHSGSTGSERLGGAWGLSVVDAQQLDYQTRQSVYAISTGGLSGLGIGNGRQKHQWLPEAINDCIFSVLCEELGFIGGVICMLLFALLIVQGVLIALRSPDYFGTMLGIGLMAQIGWQVFFHIGTVTATTPNTGISLPFFSSGGTSLLVLLAQMGILLSISRAGNAQEDRRRQQAAQNTQQAIQRRAETEPAE